jgi:hypothetical protein
MAGKYLIIMIIGVLLVAGCTDEQPPAPATPTPAPGTTSVPLTETAAPTGQPSPEPVAWTPDGVITDGEYSHGTELAGGRYTLFWRNDAEDFQMAMAAGVTGWVAVGFEPTSGMKDADIVLGWVEAGGPRIADMYATGVTGPHPPDGDLGGTGDIFEFGGTETDGMTVIEFSRKMDTGDSYDKAFEPGQSVSIIWALAETDVPSFQHNVGRGTGQLTFDP